MNIVAVLSPAPIVEYENLAMLPYQIQIIISDTTMINFDLELLVSLQLQMTAETSPISFVERFLPGTISSTPPVTIVMDGPVWLLADSSTSDIYDYQVNIYYCVKETFS